MTITVLLKAKTKENESENFVEFLTEVLTETRAYPGCNNIDIYQSNHNPEEFTFYEKWESIAHYERYLSMRTEQGVMDKFTSMLTTPPDIQYFDRIDI